MLSKGTFDVMDGTLMVSILAPGGKNGHNSLVFVARSPNDNPGKGEDEEVGGTAWDTGKVAFCAKGGC